jgi:serine/threonine protein kinase
MNIWTHDGFESLTRQDFSAAIVDIGESIPTINIGCGRSGSVYPVSVRGHHLVIKVLNSRSTEKSMLDEATYSNAVVSDQTVSALFCGTFRLDSFRVIGYPFRGCALVDSYLSPVVRVRAFVQLFHTVQRLHDKRVCHSDIKPTNIVVLATQCRLIDFGSAKRYEHNDTDGYDMGVYYDYHRLFRTFWYSPDLTTFRQDMLVCIGDSDKQLWDAHIYSIRSKNIWNQVHIPNRGWCTLIPVFATKIPNSLKN